jgi:hypothetical protein
MCKRTVEAAVYDLPALRTLHLRDLEAFEETTDFKRPRLRLVAA